MDLKMKFYEKVLLVSANVVINAEEIIFWDLENKFKYTGILLNELNKIIDKDLNGSESDKKAAEILNNTFGKVLRNKYNKYSKKIERRRTES